MYHCQEHSYIPVYIFVTDESLCDVEVVCLYFLLFENDDHKKVELY
jgi:hypothetical protein